MMPDVYCTLINIINGTKSHNYDEIILIFFKLNYSGIRLNLSSTFQCLIIGGSHGSNWHDQEGGVFYG